MVRALGVNHIYGTGAAVPALIAAGVAPAEECIRRAVDWLARHQNEDGGWGEDPRWHDDDPAWTAVGRAPPLRPPGRCSRCTPPTDRRSAGSTLSRCGAAWIGSCLRTQRADGSWDEPQYTGTVFPSDYYINYHLYRLVFPITALGAACARRGPRREVMGGQIVAAASPPPRALPTESAAHGRRAGGLRAGGPPAVRLPIHRRRTSPL